ncbi:ABC transporter ATP-binding protein [Streptomyces yangpuensis]|uniref:ABC transporter ATP-binding protein n=1 Tax=Streptomyces yangpuensis TaxID=1648182 RepID=UPI00365FF295
MTSSAIEATGLGKVFRRRGGWALRDCTFQLPAGRVSALVGPNGAGKSTLLALAAGLIAPSEGSVTVLGEHPADVRPRIGFVSQDKPLFPQLTVAETLRMGADLNPGSWDADTAERVAAGGGLDLGARVRSLSGGQRTRVALALALAKRPELLLLDEPVADLDPLARHELMGTLMATAARYGTTIVMSSHVIAELEDSCDYLLLVGDGRVRLAGDIDDLLAVHSLITGPAREAAAGTAFDLAPHTTVESRITGRQVTALVRPAGPLPAGWQTNDLSLEALVLAHLRNPAAPPLTLGQASACDSASASPTSQEAASASAMPQEESA